MDGKEVLTMLFDNKTWSDIDCIDEKDYLPSEAINNSATTIPECMEAFGYVNSPLQLNKLIVFQMEPIDRQTNGSSFICFPYFIHSD